MIAVILSIALLALPTSQQSAGTDRPLNPRERAVHLLSRFAFGARPGEVDRVLELGEEAWLTQQLDPQLRESAVLTERLGLFETLELGPTEMYSFTYYELPSRPSRTERQKRSMRRVIPMREMLTSMPLRQALAKGQLNEVLCEFWRNHFTVSYTKKFPAALYISDYEQRVIRNNALGSFGDLLMASSHHPAMMHYLDNTLSRRPPSGDELAQYEAKIREQTGSTELASEAAKIAAKRGLNENYGRELLELHTLGVDRSYRQADVIAAAEVLTGWGLAEGRDGRYGFYFDENKHIKGNRTFLGTVLREDQKDGTAQGDKLLKLLMSHRDTANFISTKLVRYFVNDVPPASLVKELERVFKKSKGDVPAMVKAIAKSEEFWARTNYQAKFKTPNEFLISALRITGAKLKDTTVLVDVLKAMGQPTYACDDPTGYYDTAQAWLDPGVLSIRWDAALLLAAGELDGVQVPSSFFRELDEDGSVLRWTQDMIARVLPGGVSVRTQAMVQEAVRDHLSDYDELDVRVLGPEVLGLLLGSPEFQKQ
jgi:uncharacterized protein (DUF1800 family)